MMMKEEILPQFGVLPQFLGLTVIKADVVHRSEVVSTPCWDDGLEESKAVSLRFIAKFQQIAGQNPARQIFDIQYASVRESSGTLCVE